MKDRSPFLTVVICCYNQQEFIDQCFGSLLMQTQPLIMFKVIFVDDGSTDDTLAIAKKYSKALPYLAIICHKKNKGLTKACNEALANIDTPYFVRLDADDYFSKDSIGSIWHDVQLMGDVDVIAFHRWDVSNHAGRIKKVEVAPDIYTWIAGGIVFKTESVRSVGGYSDKYWEEYDLYVKLLEAGYTYKISDRYIYYYRRGHKSMTQGYEKNKEGFEHLLKKWGCNTLKRYGDIDRLLRYYKRRGIT